MTLVFSNLLNDHINTMMIDESVCVVSGLVPRSRAPWELNNDDFPRDPATMSGVGKLLLWLPGTEEMGCERRKIHIVT